LLQEEDDYDQKCFRAIAVYTTLTLSCLSCASSLAQETQVPSPGETASAIGDAEKAKEKALRPVAAPHGEQEFDGLEEKIVDPLISPNRLTFRPTGGGFSLGPRTFDPY
jgi:hypothetical protein